MLDYRENSLLQLEAYAPYLIGNPLASLVAIKGIPGSAELAGELPFSGDDGLALDKAFGRLGWGFGSLDTRIWLGVALSLPNQPTLTAQQLQLICETVDPLALVALDDPARLALIHAFTSAEEGLLIDFTSGTEASVLGRRLYSVEGFEAALADEKDKQKAWAQLKRCVPSTIR
ncbi:MAG: hypothetical protein FWF91_06660 [Coriobacteriia bacterium]|nr:hypothetical protein [Coriobacteriia bacterium]